ncbi:hypothetical protein DENSPDRAFT_845412 [Dentipellis sp. KUC8613]|nr:hypothetical protein DENSPDRAFT_845412 [Dentipellis sp. KUC8613]
MSATAATAGASLQQHAQRVTVPPITNAALSPQPRDTTGVVLPAALPRLPARLWFQCAPHARLPGICVSARTLSPTPRSTASPPPTRLLRLSLYAGVALPATLEPAIHG